MAKKILVWLGIALVFFYIGRQTQPHTTLGTEPSPTAHSSTPQIDASSSIARAYAQQQSDIPVQGAGRIIKELADDNNGSRHQRILVKLPDGLSVLIAHNIDLAPRIDGIQTGGNIEFKGEYAWNPKGGVLHWTHHDPSGRHPDGWLKYQNRTYR